MLKKMALVGLFVSLSFSCLHAMNNNEEFDFEVLKRLLGRIDSTKSVSQTRDARLDVENCLWRKSSILKKYPAEKCAFFGIEYCCSPIITCCSVANNDKDDLDQFFEAAESIKLGCVTIIAKSIIKGYYNQIDQNNSKLDVVIDDMERMFTAQSIAIEQIRAAQSQCMDLLVENKKTN